MSLTLYFHPLSSFCQKVLTALYENATPFTPRIVDLGNADDRAALLKLWPFGKFPVLRDDRRDLTVPESTTIIEYLAQCHPGPTQLVPSDPDRAREVRLADRVYDQYVSGPMQKIVGDRLRPPGRNDPHGVAEARALLTTAYGMIDREMATRTWATGEAFTMADCAAAPALYYADLVQPFGDPHGNVSAYLRRLLERPSFARAVEEAAPYRHLLPK